MPEGHVTHRLAGEFTRTFAGRPVRVSSPQGRFAESAALLDGRVFERGEAYGKNLFLHFGGLPGTGSHAAGSAGPGNRVPGLSGELPLSEHIVHIHLGLIGKLALRPLAPPQGLVRLRVDDGRVAADLTGPQTCALVTEDQVAAVCAKLGADPLRPDADPDVAWARIHRSAKPVAALLMDQRITAGVGNIYRCEVLFRHRINPMTPGNRLKPASWRLIWQDLTELMPLGVRDSRIDTVRAEHTPEAMGRDPRIDRHGGEVYVYRRDGQPCHVCHREVRVTDLEGRHLFWCPTCQRRS